jgi:hypothetical protein
MNKSYNIYFDPEIEGDDIVVCGIDDFKCGDRLILVNTIHMTSGDVKSQIPKTPDKPSGLYVGIRLSMDLGIDADNGGDIINVLSAGHPSSNTLNIEFRSNDSDIHKVILGQMNFSLERSFDLKKMNIAIYNHSFASTNVAGIGINLDALEEDPWAVSEKIGRAVQAVVAKYLLDLKDLKKFKNRDIRDNEMNENKNAYPVYYDASIKDDNIVISRINDFKCGDPLFLINIEKTATGTVSEIVDNRNPGFYIGDHLASQLVIDFDPGGDVIHAMKIIPPEISNQNNG